MTTLAESMRQPSWRAEAAEKGLTRACERVERVAMALGRDDAALGMDLLQVASVGVKPPLRPCLYDDLVRAMLLALRDHDLVEQVLTAVGYHGDLVRVMIGRVEDRDGGCRCAA